MGKKVKTGKSRKDKYYHLAKETGLRSRAAFKLLQLNRKFHFLEKSRVCIDLCAAPGGWLQVAQQNMPMSSLILGVDLVPIKPIPNVMAFQEDITTEKCRQTLKKEMHTWKADVVLHDGAPNVGRNWLHDAFQQAELTLQALKLATQFLRKGGWFVTKVFRSKDYHALIWVFKQLFKSVHATKPQASRNESAEIFVVCQHYRAPDKLDPKFLDVKYVFKDVNIDTKQMLNLIHPEKISKKAEGYDENDTAFHNKVTATQFLQSENHLDLLSQANEIVVDTDDLRSHALTTTELLECCKDIKVLGKKEIRILLTWRKNMRKYLSEKNVGKKTDAEQATSEEDSAAEEAELDKQIAEMKEEQSKELKRKRKKVMKEKRKLRDKMQLKMIHPGDHIEETDDVDMFNLKKIKQKKHLDEIHDKEMVDEPSDEEDPEEIPENQRKYMMAYDRFKEDAGSASEDEEDGTEDEEPETDEDEDSEMETIDEDKVNPLVVDLETQDSKISRKTDMWFNKDMFSGLEEEADEDLEIEKMVASYKKKGGTVIEKTPKKKTKQKKKSKVSDSDTEDDDEDEVVSRKRKADSMLDSDSDDSDYNSDDDSDSDFDVQASVQRTLIEKTRGDKMKTKANVKNQPSKDGFEIVPANAPPKKIVKLDPVELALGEELIKSSKRRRELEEMSYNRYSHGDEDLPDWFSKEEVKHNRKQMPVTKEQINANKERLKAIDARPIKKIGEAKARKKKKATKKLERARKKAESVSDSVEMSDGEKWKQIKDIYKRAGLLTKKKKEVSYVVAKKGGGKKPVRPDGVKGFYKMVDKRQKKDKRAKKMADKKGKRKGKR